MSVQKSCWHIGTLKSLREHALRRFPVTRDPRTAG
jgi:hypothetical protein